MYRYAYADTYFNTHSKVTHTAGTGKSCFHWFLLFSFCLYSNCCCAYVFNNHTLNHFDVHGRLLRKT